MQTKLRAIMLTITLSFCYYSISAQILSQDSRGKELLEMYKANSVQSALSPAPGSLQLTYTMPFKTVSFLDSAGRTTITASRAINFSAKLTNNAAASPKPFSLTSTLIRPSYRFEIGYQRTIDKFDNIRLIPSNYSFVYTAGISFFTEFQNVNFYDTTTKLQRNQRPFVWGIHGHLTLFKAPKGRYAIAFSGDIGKSYNQDGLVPYSLRGNNYVDANILAIGDVEGNIGAYQRIGAYRLRMAIPFYFSNWMNIMPHVSVFGNVDYKRQMLAGVTFNFFNGSPWKAGSGLEQGFGIGVDWIHKETKWGSANFFIFGSASLASIKNAITTGFEDLKSTKNAFLGPRIKE